MPITQELTIRMENRSGFPGKVCRELVDQSVDITAFQSIPGEKTLLVCIVVDRPEAAKTWRFVRSGALVLGAIEDAELQHVHGLMSRHWDRPMDFADGTLVYLAKREFLSVILTVDHADFATYRIEGKRQFRVLPADHP